MMKHSQKFNKILSFLIFCWIGITTVGGQNLANMASNEYPPGDVQDNKMALKAVLDHLSSEYDLQFNFDEGALKDKMVEMEKIKEVSGSIDKQLSKILKSMDLKLEQYSDNTFLIYPDRSKNKKSIEKIESTRPGPHSGSNMEEKAEYGFTGNVTRKQSSKIEIFTSQNQGIQVSGKVTSQEGDPLPGVNVVVQGTSEGTVTDVNGNYNVQVVEDGTLIFSFVGYQTKNVPVEGRSNIDVSMTEDVSELEEVVVVGYGTQSKEEVTGAVSSVGSEDIETVPATTTGEALQGKASGVTVLNSHTPGDDATVRIRGMTTINDSDPLWVVDGVPGAEVNPSEIKNIQVLKGASAAAIYGARGANGVILVETKSGQFDAPTEISFSARSGFSRAKEGYDLLNTQEFGELYWLEQKNDGIDPGNISHTLYGSGDAPDIPEYANPPRADPNSSLVDPSNYDRRQTNEDGDPVNIITKANQEGTNWFDEITRQGMFQKYDLSMVGGSESTAYGFSSGYLKEEGILKYSDFERYFLSFNSRTKVTDWLNAGGKLRFNYEDDEGNKGSGNEGTVIAETYRMQPIIPVRDIMGNYAGTQVPSTGNASNPVAILYRDRNDWNHDLNGSGHFNLEATIIEGLKAKSLFGFDYSKSDSKGYGYRDRENSEPSTNHSVSRYSNEGKQWNWFNTLTYSKSIGENHDFDLMVGSEAVESQYIYMNAGRLGYFSPDLTPSNEYMVLNSGETNQTNGGSESSWSTFSLFTRLNYQFSTKYILNATFRRDGSSRFGENNRYGNFPALSLGWRVTEEDFMQSTAPWLGYLKLRAGWGKVGNDRIGNYNGFTTFASNVTNSYYPIDGANTGNTPGIESNSFGNPDAKWETTSTYNFGFEATMIDYITLDVDLWQKNTTDMLYPATIPAVVGQASTPSINIGEMKNSGIDVLLKLSQPESTGDFSYDITATISHYKNEVVKLSGAEGEKIWGPSLRHMTYTRAEPGTAFPEFYGYQVEGIFQDQAEADQHPTAFGEGGTYNEPGRFKYKDVNDDGVIDGDDRTYIGSPHPDFTTGLSINLRYKNFDLVSSIYGSYGNDVVNYVRRWQDFRQFNGNRSKRRLYESWGSPYLDDNANATMPKAESEDNGSQRPSSYFLEDGSYLRMQNLEIGYTLPDNLLSEADVRAFAQLSNVFTITGYEGLDPEVHTEGMNLGMDRGAWPTPQRFLVGLNVNL